jgi:predicted 3-demethylubiquinone-9 3-methyltransferase (glyoxalase superfamily)
MAASQQPFLRMMVCYLFHLRALLRGRVFYWLGVEASAGAESMLQSRNDRAGAPESVRKAAFSVGGQSVLCTDSVVKHDFTFTPAISFFVVCESEEEIRRLSFALSEGGTEFMPLGEYGFSRQFAWVGDRFGISWQLSLD